MVFTSVIRRLDKAPYVPYYKLKEDEDWVEVTPISLLEAERITHETECALVSVVPTNPQKGSFATAIIFASIPEDEQGQMYQVIHSGEKAFQWATVLENVKFQGADDSLLKHARLLIKIERWPEADETEFDILIEPGGVE